MFHDAIQNVLYMFIFVVAVTLIFFFMSYFPEKKISNFFAKRFNLVSRFLLLYLSCYVVFCGVQAYLNINTPDENEAKNIASCKMIEENVYHGFFSSNTNKLDCNGVIKNISVSDYQSAINAVNKKNQGG